MNNILIQSPTEKKSNTWLNCTIKSVSFNNVTNSGVIRVTGVVKSDLVETPIHLKDVEKLLQGEIVESLHKYFKVQVLNETVLNTLKTFYYGK